MLRYLVLGILLLLPSFAQADAPPGAVYPTAPFTSNPKYFTSVPCGAPVRCLASDTEILAAANLCASQRLGFPANLLGAFVHDGRSAYKNCAIPTTYAPMGNGLGAKAQWPVCCLSAGNGPNCQLTCHFYLTNEFNG